MSKVLCYVGLVVSALILLIFGLDLVTSFMIDTAFPFGGMSITMDIGFVLASAVLAYLSWTTLREQS